MNEVPVHILHIFSVLYKKNASTDDWFVMQYILPPGDAV